MKFISVLSRPCSLNASKCALRPPPLPSTSQALDRFNSSRRRGVPFDAGAFPHALAALRSFPSLGRQLHALLVKAAAASHPVPATALLDSYSKSGFHVDAVRLFDEMPQRDVIAWNALISCFVRHGLAADAMSAFRVMGEDGLQLTGVTLCSVLKACASLRAVRPGRQIHARVIAGGDDSVVMNTAIIDFYSCCGMIQDAVKVFDGMSCEKDVVIYNSLISACVQNKWFKTAFSMLRLFQPNVITLTCVLSACSESLSLRYGKQAHCIVVLNGFNSDTILCNALIDMYAKCGELVTARMVFDRMLWKNVVSWTSIIDAYGIHGQGIEAYELFKMMEEENRNSISPNAVTFLSILSACCHSGLVEEGKYCFYAMKGRYAIDPGPEHYACFMDLLGRAGKIEEAWDLYCNLSLSSNRLTSAVCIAMLNACMVCMDLERGKQVGKHLLELDQHNPASYISLSKFYAAFGKWKGADDLRKVMKDRGLTKEVGNSQIAIEGCS